MPPKISAKKRAPHTPRLLDSFRLLSATVGRRHAMELSRAELVLRIARRLAGPAWLLAQPPSMSALVALMPSVSSPNDVLDWLGVPAEEQRGLLNEFAAVSRQLADLYAITTLAWPTEWAVESSTGIALYAAVRSRKPTTIVETGIANGHSSFLILSALARNGAGRLASVDVRRDVGQLVPSHLADRWSRLIFDDRRPDFRVLSERLAPFVPFDIFFHDGDHRFLGQMLDYKLAAEHLAPLGLLVSDDIDASSAWLDAASLGILPNKRLLLIDKRKAIGIAVTDVPGAGR
jgi:predicted O-methyltransferase YrrM